MQHVPSTTTHTHTHTRDQALQGITYLWELHQLTGLCTTFYGITELTQTHKRVDGSKGMDHVMSYTVYSAARLQMQAEGARFSSL